MGAAIYHFQQIQNLYPLFWTGLLFTIGVAESKAIARNWQPPGDVNPGGKLEVLDLSIYCISS